VDAVEQLTVGVFVHSGFKCDIEHWPFVDFKWS